MGQKQLSRFLNPIGVYSTKYFDDESQLYYYGYRYYFPEVGRWNKRDPIGEKGGVNLFTFIRNNPINLIDLFGLMLGSEGHGEEISPTTAYNKVYSYQAEANGIIDKRIINNPVQGGILSFTRNAFILKKIAFKKIGTGPSNRFVYTCKYGWIDLGHFFKSAYGSYTFGRTPAALGAEMVEWGQTFLRSILQSESAFSPEDKRSNYEGRNFGEHLFNHDMNPANITQHLDNPDKIWSSSEFLNIAQEWDSFLKQAGSIKWGTGIKVGGMTVKEWVESTKQEYIDDYGYFKPLAFKISGSDKYKETQQIWKCLCGGDVPNEEALRY